MKPELSLLDVIREPGYEASLITTFNAFLPFYENVVLRRLQRTGIRHNVLLMDAGQCTKSLLSAPPRSAGRSYSLLPIHSSAGVFHPKVMFLVGKNKGALLVGSHNITLSGWGFNREISNFIQIQDTSDEESIGLMWDAWCQIKGWLQASKSNLSNHLIKMVNQVTENAPWLKEGKTSKQFSIISAQEDRPSLWEQLCSQIEAPVTRVIVLGAFFDKNLRFIERIHQDLNPIELVIGIDPESVKAPDKLIQQEHSRIIDVSQLNRSNTSSSHNYLHAKTLIIETVEETFLVCGSANPSAPAWLEPNLKGNIEIMLVRKDEKAKTDAKHMGILDIPNMPEVTEARWTATRDSRDRTEWETNEHYVSVGVAEVPKATEQIEFEVPDRYTIDAVELLGIKGQVLYKQQISSKTSKVTLDVSVQIKNETTLIQCYSKKEIRLVLILHHQRKIEEHTQSGSQKQFRKALESLDTNSPDIEMLIWCFEKIIFESPLHSGNSNPPASFSEDSDRKANTSKPLLHRIRSRHKSKRNNPTRHTTGDIGYILDQLIYRLRSEYEHLLLEDLDEEGRNEEEQREADNDNPNISLLNKQVDHQDILSTCHRKVQHLVKRMNGHLNAYKEKKIDLDYVVVRLTAVLALLRELKKRDSKLSWVTRGQTTVPSKAQFDLIKEIGHCLYEGDRPLFNVCEHHEHLIEREELARLKGLILWLAWDCKLSFRLTEPFGETIEEKKTRIYYNALLLAIIQVIEEDQSAIEEAYDSITSFPSFDPTWLESVKAIDAKIEILLQDSQNFIDATQAKSGDLAFHSEMASVGIRLISRKDSKYISMSKLGTEIAGKKTEVRSFEKDKILIIPFEKIKIENSILFN